MAAWEAGTVVACGEGTVVDVDPVTCPAVGLVPAVVGLVVVAPSPTGATPVLVVGAVAVVVVVASGLVSAVAGAASRPTPPMPATTTSALRPR
ncbi:MAG TPA: hypothetical protein VFP61_14490 [Acidimicrobiales bacterium]|nr:hypothetical protein [Acidimicrobiales bacterium]